MSHREQNSVNAVGKLGSRLSIWQNKINTHQTTQQLINRSKQTTKNKSKSIDEERLKYFSHSGEKYFKILIDAPELYKDKSFRISSKQNYLKKEDITRGTYITNKIVLLGEPYNLFCDSRHVEPIDIDHCAYLEHRKLQQNKSTQEFANKLKSIEQQMTEIATNEIKQNDETEENKETNQSMLICDVSEVITPQIPQQPIKDCRAYFTGVYMGCDVNTKQGYGIPYKVDIYSEYVGAGAYPKNSEAFPKAVASTFDGIAIDKNTRVIIWENENFEGQPILDQVGPALISNIYAKQNGCPNLLDYTFDDEDVQNNFPLHTRMWSKSNMHSWSNGSVKVVGANQKL